MPVGNIQHDGQQCDIHFNGSLTICKAVRKPVYRVISKRLRNMFAMLSVLLRVLRNLNCSRNGLLAIVITMVCRFYVYIYIYIYLYIINVSHAEFKHVSFIQ